MTHQTAKFWKVLGTVSIHLNYVLVFVVSLMVPHHP